MKFNIELKTWLEIINLPEYYDNFIENNIFDINILLNSIKNKENTLKYDDIEYILKIHKPGHIYRILMSLEIWVGLINSKIVNFVIKKVSQKNNK